MTLIADAKGRITLPQPFKPSDAFDISVEGNRVVLVKLETREHTASNVIMTRRKGKHTVARVAGFTITSEQVKALLNGLL